jgi:hypothetical protein
LTIPTASWWLGDGWAYGEARYGERKAIVEAEDWEGPAYQTCREAAVVSSAFPELFRRRNNLSFSHHKEVAALPPDEADALLDWCRELFRIGRAAIARRFGSIGAAGLWLSGPRLLAFLSPLQVAAPRMLTVQNLFGSSPTVKFGAF